MTGLSIFLHGSFNNFWWQEWAGCLFVPVQCFQVVTYKLFVKTGWAGTGFPAVLWPETGRIRCQDFIHQVQLAIVVETKLKLGIGDDDSAFERIAGSELIYLNADIPDLAGHILTDQVNYGREINIFIMITGGCLG